MLAPAQPAEFDHARQIKQIACDPFRGMIGAQYDRERLIALGKDDDFVVGYGAHIKRRNTGIPYLFREFAFPFIVSRPPRNHGAPA